MLCGNVPLQVAICVLMTYSGMAGPIESVNGNMTCDSSLGLYPSLEDGSCPQEMQLVYRGCCTSIKCNHCGPGYRKNTSTCWSSCVPCEDGFYSNLEDNYLCQSCARCDMLYRTYTSQCQPDRDTVCGPCILGYHEEDEATRVRHPACSRCCDDNMVPECLTYFAKLQANETESVLVLASESGLTQISVLLLLAVTSSIALVVVWRTKVLEPYIRRLDKPLFGAAKYAPWYRRKSLDRRKAGDDGTGGEGVQLLTVSTESDSTLDEDTDIYSPPLGGRTITDPKLRPV